MWSTTRCALSLSVSMTPLPGYFVSWAHVKSCSPRTPTAIHLYLSGPSYDTEVRFVSLIPPGDKYAGGFYSPVVMDHFYTKAVEEAT